jgi:hypothetical protein
MIKYIRITSSGALALHALSPSKNYPADAVFEVSDTVLSPEDVSLIEGIVVEKPDSRVVQNGGEFVNVPEGAQILITESGYNIEIREVGDASGELSLSSITLNGRYIIHISHPDYKQVFLTYVPPI